MKKLLFLAAALSAACAASAQGYYTDAYNPDITRHTGRIAAQRAEFILPEVNGYNVYKADLHTHSVYSDGDCTPEFRVREAWYDGLDVLAITEHVEYRRHEGKMLNFLKGYVPEGTEAINNNIIRRSADERGIQSDLNLPVKLARETARKYGLTIIPGAEITREPIAYGHYNALFTTDNNSLYATDALQSLRNAKAQGALVMHNHPGWRRKSLEHPEFEVKAYGEGLIDGIEIMNGAEFYPKAIARAHARKLFVSANTDIHDATAETYRLQGHSRNMTLIFARNNSQPTSSTSSLSAVRCTAVPNSRSARPGRTTSSPARSTGWASPTAPSPARASWHASKAAAIFVVRSSCAPTSTRCRSANRPTWRGARSTTG